MPAYPIAISGLRLASGGQAAALDPSRGSRPLRIAGQVLFWPLLLKAGLVTGALVTALAQHLVALG